MISDDGIDPKRTEIHEGWEYSVRSKSFFCPSHPLRPSRVLLFGRISAVSRGGRARFGEVPPTLQKTLFIIHQMSLVASFEVVDRDEFHANNVGGEDFSRDLSSHYLLEVLIVYVL